MRRFVVAAAVFAGALVWAPTTASAKGAADAVLRGPDVLNTGVAKLDRDQTNRLALATGVYSAIVRPGASGSRLAVQEPARKLGTRYVATFNFLTGEDRETTRIRQRLYPFAADGPVSFTPSRQRLCDRCGRIGGGWFPMTYDALDVLAAYRVRIPQDLDRSTWPTRRDDATGLSISYPPTWRAAPSTLTPVLADPIVPLAVGTAAMVPQQRGECDIVPQRAVEAVGSGDALVAVYLYQGSASWSSKMERPSAFGPELPWNTGPVQCTDGNPNATVRTLAFADGAERITVMTVVGKDATPQRVAEVYAVLDSLRAA